MSLENETELPFDRSTATDIQVLAIKNAEIHALGMGYLGAGNRPDNKTRIEITGINGAGTMTCVQLIFYPVGDSRIINAFYSADRRTLTITQSLAALPGWIAALTAIPTNEAVVLSYYANRDRYEFECLRVLTSK